MISHSSRTTATNWLLSPKKPSTLPPTIEKRSPRNVTFLTPHNSHKVPDTKHPVDNKTNDSSKYSSRLKSPVAPITKSKLVSFPSSSSPTKQMKSVIVQTDESSLQQASVSVALSGDDDVDSHHDDDGDSHHDDDGDSHHDEPTDQSDTAGWPVSNLDANGFGNEDDKDDGDGDDDKNDDNGENGVKTESVVAENEGDGDNVSDNNGDGDEANESGTVDIVESHKVIGDHADVTNTVEIGHNGGGDVTNPIVENEGDGNDAADATDGNDDDGNEEEEEDGDDEDD